MATPQPPPASESAFSEPPSAHSPYGRPEKPASQSSPSQTQTLEHATYSRGMSRQASMDDSVSMESESEHEPEQDEWLLLDVPDIPAPIDGGGERRLQCGLRAGMR